MKNKKSLPYLLICFLALAVSFQNCSPSAFEVLKSTSEDRDDVGFFRYPYKETPKFFANLSLYKLDSEVSGIISLRAVAAASRIHDEANINYELSVLGPDGSIVCPRKQGVLRFGESLIELDCVSNRNPNEISLKLELKSGAETQVFEQSY